jgi:hypothetical protein
MLRPTDRQTRLLLAPALVFIATSIDRNYQTDLWHHLARGRVLVEEGVLLNADRFTYTVPDQPLRDVNWAWQAAFYWLYRAGGLPLVQTVNSAILALTMAILCGIARRRCGSPAVASGVCIAAFLGLWPLLIIRPQTLSLLLFVVLMAVLEAATDRRRWLLVPPLILACWVNLHGGFPIGLALVGAYGLATGVESLFRRERDSGPRLRRVVRECAPWMLCLVGSLAATLENPYGWHVYEYVGLTSGRASGRHIDEWLPPSTGTLTGKVFVLSIIATLVLSALSRRRPSLREVIVPACFLLPACGSVRMVAWWLLACTPLLAGRVADAFPRLSGADADDDRISISAALVNVVLVLVCVFSTPWLEAYNPVFRLPGRGHRVESDLQAIADEVRERGARRVFCRFSWGEYLEWTLAPDATVFMDGRIEIYPDEVWDQYSAVTRGRADWEKILGTYQVDCLVLDASGYDGQLLPFVRDSGRWQEAFRQGDAVVFLREPGEKALSPRTRPKKPSTGPRADATN